MVVFRNRMAWAVWIFMGIWLSFLAAMTIDTLKDGPPDGYAPATIHAVLGAFWLVGLAVTKWVCTLRLLRVEVADSGALDITWRSPVSVARRRVEAADVPHAVVIHGKDSDGDPYFTGRATLADGTELDLAESHAEAEIARAVARFNAVAGLPHARVPVPSIQP